MTRSRVDYTFLCSDPAHPVYRALEDWIGQQDDPDRFALIERVAQIDWTGDILFLVSCSEIVRRKTRGLFEHTLVFHASDLPKGRGWSPYVWEIVGGADHITLSLIDAGDSVDTGDIWAKRHIPIASTDLWSDVNRAMFAEMFALVTDVVNNPDDFTPQPQSTEIEPTYYAKRSPADSRLDLDQNLRSQFNLLRMCDPDRYPAFFDIDGQRFTLRLEKVTPLDPDDQTD